MITLRTYNGVEWIDLDLYDSDPIKLSIAIEDIQSSQPISSFSKTFRVPATSKNNFFFRNVFFVEGRDYDVTIKNTAYILSDGELIKEGHIRLVKVYKNDVEDRIEYEVLFLGELRDFATLLGDRPMCELDLNINIGTTASIVENSWYLGVADGDVVFPLVDFGLEYDPETGAPTVTNIAMPVDTTLNTFNDPDTPLLENRLKPIIRVKRVVDSIFDSVGYTYESQFLESDLIDKLYTPAFAPARGTQPSIFFNKEEYSENYFSIKGYPNYINYDDLPDGVIGKLLGPYLQSVKSYFNEAGNYDPDINAYVAPLTGDYTFSLYVGYNYYDEFTTFDTILVVNDVVEYSETNDTPVIINVTVNLTAGDIVRLETGVNYTGSEPQIFSPTLINFEVLKSPGDTNFGLAFDCDYKQIDFIRDLITHFKLVIAPVPFKEKHFKIEPWNNYIGTGKIWDYSKKVNRNKDIVIEPLFDSQFRGIDLRHSAGNDVINDFHQKANDIVNGRLELIFDNELLSGKREIKTSGSPVLLSPIDGQPLNSRFVIPKVVTYKGEGDKVQKLPIKTQYRFFFYNGMIDTYTPNWYLQIGSDLLSMTQYPLISPYSELNFNDTNDINEDIYLNFNKDITYFTFYRNTINNAEFNNLYEKYWKRYIENLYNKWSRRVEFEMVMSPDDLKGLEFCDIIFIDGVYYYIDKIIDLPLDEVFSQVKVSLIKFNDFTLDEYKPSANCIWNENTQKWELQIINWDCEIVPSPTPTPTGEPTPTPTPTATPTPTPTPTPTACPTYYELAGCNEGDFAYTTITPTLGVGQRYVLPGMTPVYYTYTGASLQTCEVPGPHNASIQITNDTGCPE